MAWSSLFVVALAGLVGGFIAWIIPGGFRKKLELDDPEAPYQPGVFASMSVGAFAAVVAWGLGEGVSGLYLVGGPAQVSVARAAAHGVTVGEFVSGMAIGLAGFKWLANHWSSKLNNLIAQKAAAAQPSEELQRAIANDHPKLALEQLRGR